MVSLTLTGGQRGRAIIRAETNLSVLDETRQEIRSQISVLRLKAQAGGGSKALTAGERNRLNILGGLERAVINQRKLASRAASQGTSLEEQRRIAGRAEALARSEAFRRQRAVTVTARAPSPALLQQPSGIVDTRPRVLAAELRRGRAGTVLVQRGPPARTAGELFERLGGDRPKEVLAVTEVTPASFPSGEAVGGQTRVVTERRVRARTPEEARFGGLPGVGEFTLREERITQIPARPTPARGFVSRVSQFIESEESRAARTIQRRIERGGLQALPARALVGISRAGERAGGAVTRFGERQRVRRPEGLLGPSAEFFGGAITGVSRDIRERPLTTVVLPAVGGAAFKGVGLIAGRAATSAGVAPRLVSTAGRITTVSLGGAFVAGTSVEAATASDIGRAGQVVGRRVTQAAAFGAGARLVSPPRAVTVGRLQGLRLDTRVSGRFLGAVGRARTTVEVGGRTQIAESLITVRGRRQRALTRGTFGIEVQVATPVRIGARTRVVSRRFVGAFSPTARTTALRTKEGFFVSTASKRGVVATRAGEEIRTEPFRALDIRRRFGRGLRLESERFGISTSEAFTFRRGRFQLATFRLGPEQIQASRFFLARSPEVEISTRSISFAGRPRLPVRVTRPTALSRGFKLLEEEGLFVPGGVRIRRLGRRGQIRLRSLRPTAVLRPQRPKVGRAKIVRTSPLLEGLPGFRARLPQRVPFFCSRFEG